MFISAAPREEPREPGGSRRGAGEEGQPQPRERGGGAAAAGSAGGRGGRGATRGGLGLAPAISASVSATKAMGAPTVAISPSGTAMYAR